MWHVCEEHYAHYRTAVGAEPDRVQWERPLFEYKAKLDAKYQFDRQDIAHWANVVRLQFPLYVKHWQENPDVLNRTPAFQELPFNIPYKLPSGRIVRLRGKIDAGDMIGQPDLYIQEDKTKSEIDEAQLKRQLMFDMQTMIYLTAIHEGRYEPCFNKVIPKGARIAGVRYNVVRRPLSGGKGTIVRGQGTAGAKCNRKSCREGGVPTCDACHGSGRVGGKPPETEAAYYARVAQYIKNEPSTYFARWKVEVSKSEVDRFRRETLDPILEQLCQWYDWIEGCEILGINPFGDRGNVQHLHYRHPFGLYNVLDEGGSTEYDNYLNTGSTLGLEKATSLFEELETAAA